MNGTVTPDPEDKGNNPCFPSELRFVRCGRRERWREVNLARQEIHFGWSEFPHGVLQRKDLDELKNLMTLEYAGRKFKHESARKTALSNSLRELLDALQPERFTWITIAHDKLWWCTAKQGIEVTTESDTHGHFFARCDRAWSDQSLTGVPLELKTLPKSVSVVSRYQGTLCEPKQGESI